MALSGRSLIGKRVTPGGIADSKDGTAYSGSKCPACGAKSELAETFCTACGASLGNGSESRTAVIARPAEPTWSAPSDPQQVRPPAALIAAGTTLPPTKRLRSNHLRTLSIAAIIVLVAALGVVMLSWQQQRG